MKKIYTKMGNYQHGIVLLLSAILVMMIPGYAISAPPSSLKIELNKLEEVGKACRVYMIFENGTDSSFTSLKLDLVTFDKDGIISKRLAVEGAPLVGGKTSVKLFDIADSSCSGIQRILLNDVLACQDESGERNNCLGMIELSSRAGVPYGK